MKKRTLILGVILIFCNLSLLQFSLLDSDLFTLRRIRANIPPDIAKLRNDLRSTDNPAMLILFAKELLEIGIRGGHDPLVKAKAVEESFQAIAGIFRWENLSGEKLESMEELKTGMQKTVEAYNEFIDSLVLDYFGTVHGFNGDGQGLIGEILTLDGNTKSAIAGYLSDVLELVKNKENIEYNPSGRPRDNLIVNGIVKFIGKITGQRNVINQIELTVELLKADRPN